ncbi:MAG TPA: GntR family transcriptional regulator [Gaiellaceae bacterium]|nr:GntR family transcriptional regulator [Gaiellaceae bacterium]
MSENHRALVDELAATLQTRVLTGQIPTGTWLRQESVAAEFGVSRTPVREALRKLQASGLVEVRPQRGALVRMPSPREVREAYEVRAELEGLAARLAATRIRDDELRRLREAQELFRHSVATLLAWRDGHPPGETPPVDAHAEWMQANDSFHVAIQDAAGNRRLRATLTDLHQSFPRDLTWIALGENAGLLEENVAQHEAVLDAIERHDPPEARRLMIQHVLAAGELVTRRFEERAG